MLTDAYRNAPSGIGPLAYEWSDKPHRLVYDLCIQVEERDFQIEELKKENEKLREKLKWQPAVPFYPTLWVVMGDNGLMGPELLGVFLNKPDDEATEELSKHCRNGSWVVEATIEEN